MKYTTYIYLYFNHRFYLNVKLSASQFVCKYRCFIDLNSLIYASIVLNSLIYVTIYDSFVVDYILIIFFCFIRNRNIAVCR